MSSNQENVFSHPATRVLAVLELLQTHGRMSGAELAERLGVDRRTVRRYIALLEEMGIPITTERGPAGGYELVAGFKLPPMMFTNDEALAISLGLAAARGLGLADGAAAIAGALAKLERVLPATMKGRIQAVGEAVTFAERAGLGATASVALGALSAGAHGRVGVRLRYTKPSGEESERDFDPYGLAYRGGHWYAVGHCHLRRGLRSFRLDRVVHVAANERAFSRPAGFDVMDHLSASLATLPRKHSIAVLVQADLESVRRELFAAFGVLEPEGEHVLLRSQADDLDWYARELARLPWAFVVRKPFALKMALARHARRLLRVTGPIA